MTSCAFAVDITSKFAFFAEDEKNLEADSEEILRRVQSSLSNAKTAKSTKNNADLGAKKTIKKKSQFKQTLSSESAPNTVITINAGSSILPKMNRKVDSLTLPTTHQQKNIRSTTGATNTAGPTNQKRAFDRHSGSLVTGVKSIDKRGGSGRNNWGDPLHDGVQVPQKEKISDSALESIIQQQTTGVESEDVQAASQPIKDEEEAAEDLGPVLTLDEYLKSRAGSVTTRLDAVSRCVDEHRLANQNEAGDDGHNRAFMNRGGSGGGQVLNMDIRFGTHWKERRRQTAANQQQNKSVENGDVLADQHRVLIDSVDEFPMLN